MELKKMRCENCGSMLDLADGVLFCSHCGEKLILDDEAQNINITYKDEARIKENEAKIKESESNERIRIKELEKEERENKRDTKIGLIAGLGIPLAIILAVILYFSISGGVAKQQGKISAGNCSDYVDKNYEVVVMQFEELGFDNIVTIDLDDAGLLWNKDGTVESVSIAGNSSFESIHYFYPTDKVIISYH